jgi:hypothetical protein
VTPAGHWLEITRKLNSQGQPCSDANTSVIDVTDWDPQVVAAP